MNYQDHQYYQNHKNHKDYQDYQGNQRYQETLVQLWNEIESRADEPNNNILVIDDIEYLTLGEYRRILPKLFNDLKNMKFSNEYLKLLNSISPYLAKAFRDQYMICNKGVCRMKF